MTAEGDVEFTVVVPVVTIMLAAAPVVTFTVDHPESVIEAA